jgi:hypothetical protein
LEDLKPMLLTETLPSFAAELEELLKKEGHAELAAQVSGLKIVDRCRCGDDFCASFYTERKPQRGYGAGHRCVELEPEAGMLILDVVADKIVHVEVLYRHDIREKLLVSLP